LVKKSEFLILAATEIISIKNFQIKMAQNCNSTKQHFTAKARSPYTDKAEVKSGNEEAYASSNSDHNSRTRHMLNTRSTHSNQLRYAKVETYGSDLNGDCNKSNINQSYGTKSYISSKLPQGPCTQRVET
jgi:hypothetical protein